MGEQRPPEAAKGSSGPFRGANGSKQQRTNGLGERPGQHLKLVSSRGLVGAHSDYRRSDYAFARDQREAGIEELEWEERLPPPCRSHWLAALVALACPPDMLVRRRRTAPLPWMFWLAVVGSWTIFGAAFWGLIAIL